MSGQVFVNVRRGLVVFVVFFALLGLAYPLAETGVGRAFFAHQAAGSLTKNGSLLIGQRWRGPEWFQGRPDGDDPMATGGSNLGPRSVTLVHDVERRIAQLKREGITPTPDLVTTSGSGVDPDISPASAYGQVDAVAKARGLAVTVVRRLVQAHVQPAQWGFLGSSYVDVLALNQALAKLP